MLRSFEKNACPTLVISSKRYYYLDTICDSNPGLGTPFFSVLFRAVRYVLFRSFLEFLAPYETPKECKERKECNVLLQRMEKNAKDVTFFCNEQKRTREHSLFLQKSARTFRSFFYTYIEIYIDIYRYI